MSPAEVRTPSNRFGAARDSLGRGVGFGPAVSSLDRGWRSAALFAWRGTCEMASFDALADPVVVLHVAGAPCVPVRANRAAAQISHPGLLTIIPPQTPTRWQIHGEVHSLTMHLGSRHFLDSLAQEESGAPVERLGFRCGVSDPLLLVSITSLDQELRSPSQAGPLYADAIGDLIALHLLRDAGPPRRRRHADVSTKGLREALDLLETRIETGVSLTELAQASGVSRAYFANAFRAAVGVSPHRYLTQRRILRAQDLLRSTALSLAEIAARCGFSSQAHFTAQFRRALGVTPGRYPRD